MNGYQILSLSSRSFRKERIARKKKFAFRRMMMMLVQDTWFVTCDLTNIEKPFSSCRKKSKIK